LYVFILDLFITMPAKLVPVFSKLKRKVNPLLKQKKTIVALPFKEAWPKILAWMIENPHAKTKDAWAHWHARLEDVTSLQVFSQLLKNNGMTPTEVRQKTSIKEQVQLATQSFSEVKKEHAERHMARIHKKLEQIHTVVDSIEPDAENVGAVLSLVGQLHKEGRLAYDIDDQKQVDRKVTNLAILIGADPREAQAPREVQATLVE
jgi:hypothetical protein